jgi:hypothetical protein
LQPKLCVCLLQAYILFRAELAAPFTFSAGTESLEVALFETNSIPFDEVRNDTALRQLCWGVYSMWPAAASRCLAWHKAALEQ